MVNIDNSTILNHYMKNKKLHWDTFYKKFFLKRPSNFAKFVEKKYISKKDILLDIGCGNGRDIFFFFKKGISSIGLDKSKIAIKNNSSKIKDVFFANDFCKIKNPFIFFLKKKRISKIYSRFFLHTLNFSEETIFIYNCRKILIKGGYLMLEFRTTEDPLIKYGKKISKTERIHDHYRRFIDVKDFKKKLHHEYNFFKIIYYKKSFGLARFKNENPNICRVILKKIR